MQQACMICDGVSLFPHGFAITGENGLNSSPEQKQGHYRIGSGFWAWFALGYLIFVVYGSLVPLRFHAHALTDAWEAFRDIRYLNLSIGSRADWVANILLFIPLAFFWSGTLWPARIVRRVLTTLWIFVACLGLSLSIEFAQLFFPPRTVSLNDILAESIGAAVGVSAWWIFGQRLTAWLEGWRSARGPLALSIRLLYLYAFVLFAYNLLPLDLTLSPVEIFHKWREGRVVLIPFSFVFSNPAEEFYGLLTDALIWVPVAFLWRLSPPTTRLTPILAVLLIAIFLEFLQLFVYSRVSDVTDIFTAGIGAGVGTWLSHRWGDQVPQGGTPKLQVWLWLCLGLLWTGLLATIFWYPFDFQTGRSFLAERLQSLHKVPFEAYYYGTEYRAATEVLHKVGFFLPLGVFFALWTTKIRHYSWRKMAGWFAIVAIGLVAFGIEFGQLFLPGKNVDITDWGLETLGGILGYFLFKIIHGRLGHDYPMQPGLRRRHKPARHRN